MFNKLPLLERGISIGYVQSGVGLLNQFTQPLVVSADEKIVEAIKRAKNVWSFMKEQAFEEKEQIETFYGNGWGVNSQSEIRKKFRLFYSLISRV